MRAFDLLRLQLPELAPEKTKVHLAVNNGFDNPLDVFLAGKFPEWQEYQTQRNFERPFVLGLIKLEERDRWLFAGVHRVTGPCVRAPDLNEPERELWRYPTQEETACAELTGRLVVDFTRPGRQSYLVAENWLDRMRVAEIYQRRLTIGEFPGYRAVDLSFDELRLIAGQSISSWTAALGSVGGVYLISDTASGKLYVGSASGAGGLWQRWTAYADTGHGGNVELRSLLALSDTEARADRARAFRFSILEIADIHTGETDILSRETHWKRVLLSRSHGLNGN